MALKWFQSTSSVDASPIDEAVLNSTDGCWIDGLDYPAPAKISARIISQALTVARNDAEGPIKALRLRNAHVVGDLDLKWATLVRSLYLERCIFEDDIDLELASGKTVSLADCKVRGIEADQLHLEGNLELTKGFSCSGTISLVGARIDGSFGLDGAELANPGGVCLVADRISVAEGFFCRDGFRALGEIRLIGASIGGTLEMDGAHLDNAGRYTIKGDALTVGSALYLRDGFTSRGEIKLLVAHVQGQAVFDGATLDNPGGVALSGDGARLDQALYCRKGFVARGEIQLRNAIVAGALSFSGATLQNHGGVALSLDRATATVLDLTTRVTPEGDVCLANMQINTLVDDPSTWPEKLDLDGFTYDALQPSGGGSVLDRLEWLRRGEGRYLPQSYDQLAAAFERAGREEAARKVKLEKQWRRKSELNAIGKAWSWLLYLAVGYGYRTWLSVVWLILFLVVGSVVLGANYPDRFIASGDPVPAFNAFAYTFDTLLPFIDLGQQRAWLPTGPAEYASWILIVLGWTLGTAVVAGVTGVMKRS